MTNVINFEEAQQSRALETLERTVEQRHWRVTWSAGLALAIGAMVFSSYAVYQAAQLSAWSDPVVIGALGVAGAYLLAGGFVMKVSGGLGISLRSRSEEAVVELNDEDEDEAVTLLSNEEEEKGGFAVRCPSCARVYSATLADATCPDCGRGAIAV